MERGFTLLEGGLGPPAKAIWSYQFDKLKSSADDGNRMLFLDFVGSDGEIVSSNNGKNIRDICTLYSLSLN